MDKLSTILMNVGRSIRCYKNMASLFLHSTDLQNYMIEYFVIVVKLCHKILVMPRTSWFLPYLSGYINPLAEFESELEICANAVKDEVIVLTTTITKTVSDENFQARALAGQDWQDAQLRGLEEAKNRILDACSVYDHRTPWKQIRKKGNVSLFRTDPGQLDWRAKEDSCTLVYNGSLGFGKTVLLANLIDDLYLDTSADDDRYIAYVFCRHAEPQSLRSRTVIGSLARQLLQDHSDFESQVMSKVSDGFDWDPKSLCNLLTEIFMHTSCRIYFVLDGLDECQISERDAILDAVKNLQSSFTLLFCISSRLEPYEQSKLGNKQLQSPIFSEIPDKNPELAAYIMAEIRLCADEGRLLIADKNLLDTIVTVLQLRAQGMYLWASLQIMTLCKLSSDSAILDVLYHLPSDLPATYEKLLEGNTGPEQEHQRRIMELVAVARRPLKVAELREALIVEPGKLDWDAKRLASDISKVLGCCEGLIIVEEDDLTVSFVHDSVRQFLTRGYGEIGFGQHDAEKEMAQIVTTYLNIPRLDKRISRTVVPKLKTQPVIDQVIDSTRDSSPAAKAAAESFQETRQARQDDITQVLARACENNSIPPVLEFENYAKKYWFQHSASVLDEDATTLDLATKLSSMQSARDWDRDEFQNPLMWALRNGYLAVSDMALKLFEPDMPTAKFFSALCAAVKEPEIEVIKTYVQCPALLNSMEQADYAVQLLEIAASHKNYQAISLLLQPSPMHCSTQAWVTSVFRHYTSDAYALLQTIVLSRNVELNNLIVHDVPLMEYAVRNNWVQIVEALVAKAEVQVDHPNNEGVTPLWLATDQCFEPIVSLLLSTARVDVNSKDKTFGHTPLHRAIIRGHVEIVRMICQVPSMDIEARTLTGNTPLALAALHSRPKILSLLLEAGQNRPTDLDPMNDQLRTPLSIAAGNGHVGILEILLDASQGQIDVLSCCARGRTPLSYAAQSGNAEAIQLLLAVQDYSWNETDEEGLTPLDHCPKLDNRDAIDLLQLTHRQTWM